MFNKKKIAEMDKVIQVLIERSDKQIKKNDEVKVINEILIKDMIKSILANTPVKDCPFCGNLPEISHYMTSETIFIYTTTHLNFVIGCSSPLCKAHPNTGSSTNLEKLIKDWNERWTNK